MPKTRVVQSGADDLAELGKIHEARPQGRDVLAQARKIPGVQIREDGSKFSITARRGDTKAALELAHMLDAPRRLEAERAEKLVAKRELIMVRNPQGQLVPINAESENSLSRANVIHAPSRTFMPPAGVPRCQLEGMDHDYRNGRCWWCGREA